MPDRTDTTQPRLKSQKSTQTRLLPSRRQLELYSGSRSIARVIVFGLSFESPNTCLICLTETIETLGGRQFRYSSILLAMRDCFVRRWMNVRRQTFQPSWWWYHMLQDSGTKRIGEHRHSGRFA